MAARFWLGTTSTNWATAANWSATSGGAGGAAVPTAADDVTFDANGNNPCDVPSPTARVCLSLTLTSGYTSTFTLNATLSVSGSITLHTASTLTTTAGSPVLRMIAAGTWTSNGVTVPYPTVIGAAVAFTCTLADALNISNGLTLSNSTSTTFAGAFGITADACAVIGSQTVTLSGDVTINGLTSTGNNPNVIDGAFNWNTLSFTGGSGVALSGTATIRFFGTGTWQQTSGSGTMTNNVNIDAGAGTLTITGVIPYLTGTITYTSGTVVATGSTLTISAACTLDTAGMSWNNITLTAALTLTLSSLLTASGTLTVPNAAVTFAGSAGWTVGTFVHAFPNVTRIFTFAAGKTYTITTAFTAAHGGAATIRFSYVSSSPGTAVNFVLQAGASQDVGFVDPTDIDASGGLAIFTYHGVITSSPNWINVYPAPGGGGSGGVRAFAYAG